jgi:hypothetical protein
MHTQRVLALGFRWALISLGMVMLGMLSSCGGGGDDPPPLGPTNADPTGYYTNTGTLADMSISDLQAMIYNNRILMFSKAQGYGYDGTLMVSGNSISGTLRQYALPGESGDDATLSATFNPTDHSISGTITHVVGVKNAAFTLVYAAGRADSKVADILNDTMVNPDWNGAIYNATTDPLIFTLADNSAGAATVTTMTPMASNAVFKDCTFSGTLTPVAGSLFVVNMPVSGCLNSGTYTGLAAKRGNTLIIAATYGTSLIGYYGLIGEFQ